VIAQLRAMFPSNWSFWVGVMVMVEEAVPEIGVPLLEAVGVPVRLVGEAVRVKVAVTTTALTTSETPGAVVPEN
jgi:hypothetical protein